MYLNYYSSLAVLKLINDSLANLAALKTASMNKPESWVKLEIPAPTIGDVEVVTTLKDSVMRSRMDA